jgi:hypothetical protein
MNDKFVLEEIQVAESSLADAENELGWLLKEVQAAPRAEKTLLSEALHKALQKLLDAREHLGKLETLLRTRDD